LKNKNDLEIIDFWKAKKYNLILSIKITLPIILIAYAFLPLHKSITIGIWWELIISTIFDISFYACPKEGCYKRIESHSVYEKVFHVMIITLFLSIIFFNHI